MTDYQVLVIFNSCQARAKVLGLMVKADCNMISVYIKRKTDKDPVILHTSENVREIQSYLAGFNHGMTKDSI